MQCLSSPPGCIDQSRTEHFAALLSQVQFPATFRASLCLAGRVPIACYCLQATQEQRVRFVGEGSLRVSRRGKKITWPMKRWRRGSPTSLRKKICLLHFRPPETNMSPQRRSIIVDTLFTLLLVVCLFLSEQEVRELRVVIVSREKVTALFMML